MDAQTIGKIVKASGVTEGETVLVHFWGEDSEKKIANKFMAAVAALGATPVLLQQARSVNHGIFQSAKETAFDEAYFERLSHFDGVLDVFAYQPIVLGKELPPEQMALYRRYISSLFYALMKAKRFAQIRIPTEANAAESPLEPTDYIRRMEMAYGIDYYAVHSACAARKAELEKYHRYVLHTGGDCQLHFELTGREWHIDAGDGDLPCGEVYIAPNEEETHGTLFFPKLFLEEVGAFAEVTLTVEQGVVTGSNCGAFNDFLGSLPPEERVVCELGLGMNPNVTDVCGYALLDEKLAGSFHIAIGANHMFGGKNKAKNHRDFASNGSFELLGGK